jgi:hypothetical protein
MSALRASLRDGWTQRPLTRHEGGCENGGRIQEPPGQPGPEIRTVFRAGLSVFGTSMSKLPHPSAWPVHVARPWRADGVLRAQDPLVDGQQGCALVAGWR